jgi:hypothetical protein
MAKPGARSTETRSTAGNLGSGGQPVTTSPATRVPGTTRPTPAPMPTVADMESRRQKGQSPVVPVSLATVGDATTESEQRHQPTPLPPGVQVPTKRTYDVGEK